jgi:hypothetical protein
VAQTNGTLAQVYTLRLAAAPVRDIWFSPVAFFTATSGPVAPEFVQSGDLISTSGRVVKRNDQLYTSVGAMPPGPDLGLDVVDMLPGGEIAFSLGSDIFSESLGQLQHGDLLSTRGRVLWRNQELLAAFMPEPATNDAGLDAAQVLDSGDVLFSVATNVFSKQLKVTLHRGDLLSSAGTILRTYQQLLARFQPMDSTNDHGLDAVYIWPSGEVWFSTETGFQDQTLGAILAGDLLSDQGYIVFRNLELVSAFKPTNAPPDIGLDALYIVTDATAPAPPARLEIAAQPSGASIGLSWQSQARVFQIERAENVAGPYVPLTPILPDLFFDDVGSATNHAQSWYRLGQW